MDYYSKIAKFIPTTTNILAPKFAALFYIIIIISYAELARSYAVH